MRSNDFQVIQDGGYVRNISRPLIGFEFMGFIACAMATGVDQDQPIFRLQAVDVAELVPGLETIGDPVL
jgi:hypothetical protein